ncbi:hypothetical protein [Nostoc sp. GT001]|uniref:hypothetical protein n=1 Tax=Nostoc sp. GT001 TaxID=3056647 RepID=UPI0025AA5740|nr:hypothetical protein [Nostoc sp. GT001]MDM9582315.1 hypothetical protein [Nostoc sp. GT001]
MALPENLGSFEHLQNVYRQQFNRQVSEYFKDLGDTWEPEINTSRGSLRTACTMTDEDSAPVMAMRHKLLYDVLGYGRSNLAVLYGRNESQDIPVTGHPKVWFYFSQDAASVAEGTSKLDAECSFRLMDETQSTITESKARTLATEIKNLFVVAKEGIILTKGKNQYLYFHKEKGYRLRVYGNTEADAVDVIKKLLQLTNTTYDQERLTIAVPKRSNTSAPETQIVYGQSTKKKRFRPTANVRFRYAYLEIPGRANPVFLVDTTYRYGGLVAV